MAQPVRLGERLGVSETVLALLVAVLGVSRGPSRPVGSYINFPDQSWGHRAGTRPGFVLRGLRNTHGPGQRYRRADLHRVGKQREPADPWGCAGGHDHVLSDRGARRRRIAGSSTALPVAISRPRRARTQARKPVSSVPTVGCAA
jgi:hypothetical protein